MNKSTRENEGVPPAGGNARGRLGGAAVQRAYSGRCWRASRTCRCAGSQSRSRDLVAPLQQAPGSLRPQTGWRGKMSGIDRESGGPEQAPARSRSARYIAMLSSHPKRLKRLRV